MDKHSHKNSKFMCSEYIRNFDHSSKFYFPLSLLMQLKTPCSRSWSLPTHPMNIMGNNQKIRLKIKGDFDMNVEIGCLSTVTDIGELINNRSSSEPNDELVFIHDGRKLLNALSLSYLGVEDNDTLFVFRKDKASQKCQIKKDKIINYDQSLFRLKFRFQQKYAHKYVDPESVFERVMLNSDPRLQKESARLADLYRMRVETNVSAYRKVCDRYSRQGNQVEAKSTSIHQTVVPEKPLIPSTNLLPEMNRSSSTDLAHGSTVKQI